MAKIQRFEDLECWQEARRFVGLVYRLTKNDAFRKDFELVSQLRRSAVSAMANLAEGFHRSSSKDFLRFLDYSRSSVAESISHCYVALDQGYLTEEDMEEVNQRGETVWKTVNGMMRYLRRAGAERR